MSSEADTSQLLLDASLLVLLLYQVVADGSETLTDLIAVME
jgi:hypothetical protein